LLGRRHRQQARVADRTMNVLIARLLCRLGFHDYEVIDVTFSFGPGGAVEKVKCRRCGRRTTRAGDNPS
jgi:hypothetical protein